jgi:oxygen-independent coproporphyrinogen-3 oxidase
MHADDTRKPGQVQSAGRKSSPSAARAPATLTVLPGDGPTGGSASASVARLNAGVVFEARRRGHDRAAPITSLYVHVPFCVHKCHYCDFYSFVDSRDQQRAFVERLRAELRALSAHAQNSDGTPVPLRTIFVGGGTPSLLRVDLWEQLLAELRSHFDLSLMRSGRERALPEGEFTVECNPESVTPDLMGVLRAGGVNRVSLGAQSFNPGHLRTLERRHDPENVARALEMVRAAGIPRDSIDLIYAIPGQMLEEWGADLERAVALGTGHLSCYNLTYEPNTPMTVRLRRGEFEPAPEELEVEMFRLAGEVLGRAGLSRYEVSNAARPGMECRHNLVYWRQGAWLAAGPSAAGHAPVSSDPRLGGHRWKNAPNLGTYLADSAHGYAPLSEHEPPDPARALREVLMTGVRLAEGVDAAEITAWADQLSPGAAPALDREAQGLISDGLLEQRAGRWRITERGWLMADFVARRLMRAAGRAGPGVRGA